ncbi:MAG: MFS transporter [Sphingomonadales bacterium]|nr:MAG: MFS transporter [Sphingomonadales bacterium]
MIRSDGMKGKGAAAPGAPSRRASFVALGVLMLTYLLSFVDRTALGVLQEPIKRELGLSDWQLGLLSGPAFALLYSIAGLPIARLAERYSRSIILAVSLVIWSGMTMLCGLSRSYGQLVLARVGVSVGEAGGNPVAHSLIADLFPPSERGRAIAIYSFGAPAGAFLGAVATGWLAFHFGWRTAFLMLGPPGFILTLAVIFLVPKPKRGQFDERMQDDVDAPSLRAVISVFAGNAVLRHLAMGAALIVLTGYGIAAFLPSFLIRRHGLDLGTVGLLAGIVNGLGAAVGTVASGFIVDRFGSRDARLYAWLPAVMAALSVPCFIWGFLTDKLAVAIPLLTLGTFAIYTYIAPTFAQLHNMLETRMRATGASIMYLIMNLVGLGIGPPLIGILSDRMTRMAMKNAGGLDCSASATLPGCQQAVGIGLTYALVVISLPLAWASVHFWLAGRKLGSHRVA